MLKSEIRDDDGIYYTKQILINTKALDVSNVEKSTNFALSFFKKMYDMNSTRGRTDYYFERIVGANSCNNDAFIFLKVINYVTE